MRELTWQSRRVRFGGPALLVIGVAISAMVATAQQPAGPPSQGTAPRLTPSFVLRAQVGAANRRIAAEQFDETTMVAAYENLYGRALAGRRLFSGD